MSQPAKSPFGNIGITGAIILFMLFIVVVASMQSYQYAFNVQPKTMSQYCLSLPTTLAYVIFKDPYIAVTCTMLFLSVLIVLPVGLIWKRVQDKLWDRRVEQQWQLEQKLTKKRQEQRDKQEFES